MGSGGEGNGSGWRGKHCGVGGKIGKYGAIKEWSERERKECEVKGKKWYLRSWIVGWGSRCGCCRPGGFRCGPERGNEHFDVYVSVIEPSSASQAPVFKIQRRGGAGGGG